MKINQQGRGAVGLSICAFIFSTTTIFAAPANNNFGSARVISGALPLSISASNVGATAEAGEPNHSDVSPMAESGRKSIWFSWTPTFTGNALLTTEGSGSQEAEVATTDPYVDTQVGIYTGTSVSALTVVAKKEDSDGYFKHGWTRVAFNVVSGKTYKIAVDGWNGGEGRIKLNLYNNGATRYKLSVASNPSGAGTFSFSPARPLDGYPSGTSVTVTVAPVGTNRFFGWNGVNGSSANSVTVTMNKSRILTAIFNSTRQILLQNTNGIVTEWIFNGPTFQASTAVRGGASAGSGWKLVGSGDFNGDGQKDLVFQHTDTRIAVWYMNRLTYLGVTAINGGAAAGTGWRVAGVGSFNGDATADLVMQYTDGRVAIWLMNGTSTAQVVSVRNAGTLKAFATADINYDGKTDIILQGTDHRITAWYLGGTVYKSAALLAGGDAPDSSWKPVGCGDFNRDKRADLLWQNTEGSIGIWYLSGATLLQDSVLRNGISAGTAKVGGVN